jgi:hypothetical protein
MLAPIITAIPLLWRRKFSLLLLLSVLTVETAYSDDQFGRERDIKAGYLYNFLLFTDWPDDVPSGEELKLCLLGISDFESAFAAVEGTDIKGASLAVESFPAESGPALLGDCRALFIPAEHAHKTDLIIGRLRNQSVLTVSEVSGFIQKGGMVNFVRVGDNIRFEINKVSAERENIKFRSTMLRLATRVIEESRDD